MPVSVRADLLSDLLAFHVRLWAGGLFLTALVPVSIVAALLNLIQGVGPGGGPYATVHENARSFEAWLRDAGRSRASEADAPPSGAADPPRQRVRP